MLIYLMNFLIEKKNPEPTTRTDLSKFPEQLIMAKFMDMEKILWKSPRHDHLFLPQELPKGILLSGNGGRPIISIC